MIYNFNEWFSIINLWILHAMGDYGLISRSLLPLLDESQQSNKRWPAGGNSSLLQPAIVLELSDETGIVRTLESNS